MDKKKRALLLAGLAISANVRGEARPGKSTVVGVLFANNEGVSDPDRTFKSAMRQRGYIEGTNLTIESRAAGARFELLPALAKELVEQKVDVLVCVGTTATQAAQKATTRIPIVAMNIADPVKTGLARSLGRPGGNVTGVSNLGADTSGKRLELLLALAPKARRVAILTNPQNLGNVVSAPDRSAAIKALNVESVDFPIRTAADLPAQLAAIAKARVDALNVGLDPVIASVAREIADFALSHRLPSVSGIPHYTQVGGLVAYSHSPQEQWSLVAAQVDRILNGGKTAELPFTQPTKFLLSFNRKTAKALGIVIPEDLLLRADLVVD